MNYERQERLEVIPEGFQKKLTEKRLILVGCGGVGSVLADLLVRGGFQNLVLVDNDVVDETNLQRQLYTQKDIGQPKAAVLKERLLEINPSVSLDAQITLLEEKHLGGGNLIIDCTDNFETRKKINLFCEEHNVDWLCIGALKTEVMVCLFRGSEKKFSQVFSQSVEDENCCDVGVLASTTFTAASLAYNEVLKYFLEIKENKLLKMDLWKKTVYNIELK